MFHMLSCFNLKAGEEIGDFRAARADSLATMKSIDLVEDAGPIGRRQSDTPMDTDAERDHEYFVVMSFRDRAQVGAAYAYIKGHVEPGETSHNGVYGKVEDGAVLICWQDLT
jgi:hypothetical protein